MRRLIALAFALGLATPALAQPARTAPIMASPTPPAEPPLPAAEPRLGNLTPEGVSTVAADLSGLYRRIEQDEVVMTRIRDAELAKEAIRIRALKPALKFKGADWFPLKY